MRTILTITLALTVLLSGAAFAAKQASALDPQIQNASWIWLRGFEEVDDAVVYFRKTFTLDSAPVEAVMQVTCDNEYKLWINGTFAAQTVNPGEEAWRRLDNYNVTKLLREGENYIAVQGTNKGGKAAFIAQFNINTSGDQVVVISTDSTWEAASDPGESWNQPGAEGGTWEPALDYGRAATTPPWFYPRPSSDLARLEQTSRVRLQSDVAPPASVKLRADTTANVSGIGPNEWFSWEQIGKLVIQPSEAGSRAVFVCDFGEQVVGFPMVIGATVRQTRVSVSCGEYEAECDAPYQPVLSAELKDGAIRWQAPDRRAFRYAVFTIEPETAVTIDALQAELVEYPVTKAGEFECSDAELNDIWKISRRTLKLCMQDYYEDGVKRDRLLWTGDLRVEALVGYYAFGDTGLARRGLIQLADLQLADGLIPAVGPAPSSTYLPDYCAYYVMTLADHYRYSGDARTVELLYPYVAKLMEWFRANSDEDTGLFRRADRPGWWIFIDWDDSLEKRDAVSAMQALYYRALLDAAELARVADRRGDVQGYLARADLLRRSVNSTLWDEQRGAYIDCIFSPDPDSTGQPSVRSDRVHKQPNALALIAGVPDPKMASKIVQAILDPEQTPPVTTPYMNFYVASALFERGQAAAALDLIRSYWGAMARRGATTFWEKFDPTWPRPYEQADLSYCHGWSSGPGMMLPAYVAGIRPRQPGWREALIAPDLGGLEWVKAAVPTTTGNIEVDFTVDRGCPVGRVTLPIGSAAYVMLPQPPENTFYTVDGRRVKARAESGKAVFTLRPGRSYEIALAGGG